MILVNCNSKHKQTVLVWKDGLKELGQMDMDEVLDKIRMEGTGNGQ